MSARTTLIRNVRILDPASGRDEIGSLLFSEAILDIGPRVEASDADVIDGAGLALMPGLIDMRVVIGEPGAEHKETFKSAGRAAAAGGVTTLVQMPNTTPVIDDQSLVDFVLRRGPARTGVRILPAAALTKGLEGEAMTEIGLLAEAGAVMFSNGDRQIADSRVLRRALAYATTFNALVAHRPEDPYLAAGGVMNEGELAARLGLPGIPAAAEVIMAERDLALAELTGGRLLLDMLSSAHTLEPLRRQGAWRQRLRQRQRAPFDAQRTRRRRLPHFRQAFAAAAQRNRSRRARRGGAGRADRRDRLRPRSAPGRRQALAVR